MFNFMPSTPLVNEQVNFTDESYDVDGDVKIRIWDFGDGNISLETNPYHTYKYDGNFTITLNVTDNDYATSEYSRVVEVRDIQSPIITNISAHPNPLAHTISLSFTMQADMPGIFRATRILSTPASNPSSPVVGVTSREAAEHAAIGSSKELKASRSRMFLNSALIPTKIPTIQSF